MSKYMRKCQWSPTMEQWFRPSTNACVCPKHNPRKERPKCCLPCPKPRMAWENKCVFVKGPCARHHGADCDCDVCEACREDDCEFQCHREHIEEAACDESPCFEPHDYGCRCSLCRASAKKGGIYSTLKRYKSESDKCAPTDADRRRQPEKTLQDYVLQLGEECYCLLHHPEKCECERCKACRKEVQHDMVLAKREAKRNRQLLAIVERMEAKHGVGCRCLACAATRLRIEMTMCHEHLETCRCQRDFGKACRCRVCAECIRRKRTATIPKAEDYW